jgi:hypothetical protein
MTAVTLPYLSQVNGPGAGNFVNDCGPACVAMLIHGLGVASKKPSIADVFRATGADAAAFTNGGQLKKAAAVWGVTLTPRFWGLDSMRASILSGRPLIALVHYGAFSSLGRTQSSFKGGHFLLVVGFDQNRVLVHDPLWRDQGGRYLSWEESIFYNAWEQAKLDFSNPSFWGLVAEQVYATSSAIPTEPPIITPMPGVWGTGIALTPLKLRHHAPDGAVLYYLVPGDTVEVLEPMKGGFYHVRFNGIEGWCGGNAAYITVNQIPPMAPPAPAPSPSLAQYDMLPDSEKFRLLAILLKKEGIVAQDGSVLE